MTTTPATFELEDLVLPSAPSDMDKRRFVNQWLQRLVGFFDRLDYFMGSDELQRFASNTDGGLAYEAQQQLAHCQET